MNDIAKKKMNANIKAINNALIQIKEGKLPTNELVEMQFGAITDLVEDCKRIALEK